MAIGQKALTYLPDLILASPGGLAKLESYKGVMYQIAEMQKAESAGLIYPSVVVSRDNPFVSSSWRIEKGDFAQGTVTLAAVNAADTVTINGLVYTAVAGAKSDNTQFSIDGTDTVDAADLADSIANDTRSGTVGDVTARSAGAVVTVQYTAPGTAGNAVTMSESTGGLRITLSGATLAGGSADNLYTFEFVSEQVFENSGIGRAALSSRRDISIIVIDNGNTYKLRSALTVLNFIQGLEDKVAQTGVGTTGDATYSDITLKGATPFETFDWTVQKAGAVYTVTPTANS